MTPSHTCTSHAVISFFHSITEDTVRLIIKVARTIIIPLAALILVIFCFLFAFYTFSKRYSLDYRCTHAFQRNRSLRLWDGGLQAVRQAHTSQNAEKNEETWTCLTDKQLATAPEKMEWQLQPSSLCCADSSVQVKCRNTRAADRVSSRPNLRAEIPLFVFIKGTGNESVAEGIITSYTAAFSKQISRHTLTKHRNIKYSCRVFPTLVQTADVEFSTSQIIRFGISEHHLGTCVFTCLSCVCLFVRSVWHDWPLTLAITIPAAPKMSTELRVWCLPITAFSTRSSSAKRSCTTAWRSSRFSV